MSTVLLVYEFLTKGSLENHLFGSGTFHVEPLSWSNRMKIALGAAKALAFLHSDRVKLSNFGLARVGPSDGESHVSTRVMGTFGYAAPEYIATGRECVNRVKGRKKVVPLKRRGSSDNEEERAFGSFLLSER